MSADEATIRVTDGESDGSDERRLMKDDAVVGKWVVDAQVVAMGDELTVTVDAQISDVVGGKAATRVEGSGKVVDAKADVMGRAARVDNGALSGRQGLVEGKASKAIAKTHDGRGQNMARGTVLGEAVPLRENTSHKQRDEGSVKDEGGKRGPGVFVGVKIRDRLIVAGHDGAHTIAAFAQLGSDESERVGMATRGAFKRVLIELLAAPDDGMFEVLPDGGRAVERADDDANRKDGEQQQKIPAGEDGKELQTIKDGRERAVTRQGVLLNPTGVAGRVVKHLARSLHKIDAEQADDGNSSNEQNSGTHRTEPSPRGVHRMPQPISKTPAEMMAGRIVFGRAGAIVHVFGRASSRGCYQSRPSIALTGSCCHVAL